MNLLSEKETGIVLEYSVKKCYGFIRLNDKSKTDDVFIHMSEIEPEKDNFKKLMQGEKVEFDLYRRNNGNKRGLAAKNLQIIGDAYDNDGEINGNT